MLTDKTPKEALIRALTHGRVHIVINFLIILVLLIVDVSFVAAGTLLGGIFGPGTLVCAALVGPVAGIFLPVSERAIRKIIAAVPEKQP